MNDMKEEIIREERSRIWNAIEDITDEYGSINTYLDKIWAIINKKDL